MTVVGWVQILVFFAAILAVTKPLGVYMFRVFEGGERRCRVLGRFERPLPPVGVDPRQEQTWKEYTFALLVFSALRRARHLPDPAAAAAAAAQPAALRRRRAALGVQHRRQLHDQHQLAGVLAASRR